jgi:hypothetical protein
MSEFIKDGKGRGYLASVDDENKLQVRSVTEDEEIHANGLGNAYNLNTGIITLTDANDTTVFYLKNNEENDYIITAVVIGVWASDGDGLDMNATFIRNPTTGDIITNTNAVAINSNRNYGSSNTLSADVYVGASGETKVNGDEHILVRIAEESRNFISINEVLPKGTSFAVDILPPTSNTAMNCYVAVVGYLDGGNG